jgi:hypothetical protein
MEQTIRIAFPDADAAKAAAELYAADGFDVCVAVDGTGWMVEAFRPDVERDELWTAGRLTAIRNE